MPSSQINSVGPALTRSPRASVLHQAGSLATVGLTGANSGQVSLPALCLVLQLVGCPKLGPGLGVGREPPWFGFPICQTFTKLCLQGEVTEAETGKSTARVSQNSDVTHSRAGSLQRLASLLAVLLHLWSKGLKEGAGGLGRDDPQIPRPTPVS